MKNLFFVVRQFKINSGSYAGFVEMVSTFASKQGYRVTILCAKLNKQDKEFEKHGFADIIRFKIPLFHLPFIGMNRDYLFLAKKVSMYFRINAPKEEDIIIGNGRACLGLLGHKYIMRMGQPAMVFLKNMEIANEYVSPLSKIARKIHFIIQKYLEKKCFTNASGYIFSSMESKKINFKEYNEARKPYFIPHSGVNFMAFQKGEKVQINGRFILFVSAGEEKIRKGVMYLEKVLPSIFDMYPDVNLLHVGDKFDWNLDNKYKKRIVSVGRVDWDKMKNFFQSSCLLVNCALNEWIPNAIIEAMTIGLPIVTSDIEGISEIIDHKINGFIYSRGDVIGLKNGLIFTLNNLATKQESLIKKAKKLDYDIFSNKLILFCNKVISNKYQEVYLL